MARRTYLNVWQGILHILLSYIDAIIRYLSFFHALTVKTFDLGDYRRKLGRNRIPAFSDEDYSVREQCYLGAFADIEAFFAENPSGIAVLDSMSITHYWRLMIYNTVTIVS